MAEVGELFEYAIHMMNATLSTYCGPDSDDSAGVGKESFPSMASLYRGSANVSEVN